MILDHNMILAECMGSIKKALIKNLELCEATKVPQLLQEIKKFDTIKRFNTLASKTSSLNESPYHSIIQQYEYYKRK